MLVQFLAFAKKLGLTTILISVDDSTSKKDKATRHLEAVCYHHDHNEGQRRSPNSSTALYTLKVTPQTFGALLHFHHQVTVLSVKDDGLGLGWG